MKKRGYKKIIVKKIDTIVYPYILWSVIQGLTEVFLSSYTNNHIEISDLFSILWNPRAQYWFFYALFIIFVIASLTLHKAKQKHLLAIFLCSVLIYLIRHDIPSNMIFHYFSNNFVFFAFGMLFNSWEPSKNFGTKTILTTSFIAFAMVQVIYHLILNPSLAYKNLWILPVSLTSIIFAVSLSQSISKTPKKWLLIIGQSSMAIFVLHIFSGSGIRIILLNIFEINSVLIHMVTGVIMGVGAPLICVYFIKKYKIPYVFSYPFSELFTNLKNKKIN
ncbi:MAG: acyltransferase [Emcibacteraceae bacterium]|nr:acyltransferase [Emcibacteraceae bacterium]